MCEYDPKCSKSDDVLAQTLWSAALPVRLLVVCDTSEWHPLAKVYDLGEERGGLHLCQKKHRGVLTHEGWDRRAHWHWALDSIADLIADEHVEHDEAGCRCGNFVFDIGGLANALHWGTGLQNGKGVSVLPAERVTRP